AFQARGLLVALRIGDSRRVSYALAYYAMYLGAAGGQHLVRARRLVAQAHEIAEAERSQFLRAWVLAASGVVSYFGGELETAAEQIALAEAQMRELTIGTAPELDHLRMFLLFALRRRGSFGQLRAKYVEYVRDAIRRGCRYAETTFRWSANVVWLASDEP